MRGQGRLVRKRRRDEIEIGLGFLRRRRGHRRVRLGTVLATPPNGVTPTEFGIGNFGSFDTNGRIGAWSAKMNIKGASDLHVLSNTIAPGGDVWVAQPSGAELRDHQVWDGDGLSRRRSHSAGRTGIRQGSGFVDKGRAVHIVRNEGKRRPRDGRRHVRSRGRNEARRPEQTPATALSRSDRRRVGRRPPSGPILRLGPSVRRALDDECERVSGRRQRAKFIVRTFSTVDGCT